MFSCTLTESKREEGLLWPYLQRGLWEPFLLNLFPGVRAGHQGDKRSFSLVPSPLFLSSVSLLIAPFSSPQAYLQVPRPTTQPPGEASVKLIITTVD